MDENEKLIQKADMVIGDITGANGGVLNPEQSDRFIRTLQDQPTVLNEVRVVPMNGPTQEINKIEFGNHILRPAVENTRLGETDRSKVSTSKVNLQTQEVIAEVLLPYGVLEDNIERGNLRDTILDLIAERAALDMEDIIIRGDTANAAFVNDLAVLGQFDGVLKQITSHVVDAGTPASITPSIFNDALKAMPGKYRRNRNQLRFYTSYDLEQDYRLNLTNRDTGLGDSILTGNQGVNIFAVPLRGIALMPTASAMFLNPRNIILGIQRAVTIEAEKLISERQWKFVLTARIDVKLQEEDATVKIINLE
jgi:HK97 family phage major capsid protein